MNIHSSNRGNFLPIASNPFDKNPVFMLKVAQMKICQSVFIFVLMSGSCVYAANSSKKGKIIRERERTLKGLVTTAYYGSSYTWRSDLFIQNTKVISKHLQIHFQTCLLDDEEVKAVCDSQPNTQDKQECINKAQNPMKRAHLDDFIGMMIRISNKDLQLYFENLRCDYIIEDLAGGYFAQIRRQIQNIILNLSGADQINIERRDILLAYLNEFYGPSETFHMQEERERLIYQFQSCDYSSGLIDEALNRIDNFIGNTVIECEVIIETAKEKGITYLDIQEALKVSLTFWSINNGG